MEEQKHTWNYRVCKQEHNEYEDEIEDLYSIRTAHYINGKLKAIADRDVVLSGYTDPRDMKKDIHHFFEAFNKPVIDLDEELKD